MGPFVVHLLMYVFLSPLSYSEKQNDKRDVVSQKDIITTLPEKISTLIGPEIKTGTKYEIFGCVLELAKDGCKYTFLPKESTCQDKLSVTRLFEYFFKSIILRNVTAGIMPFNAMEIERFVIDCEGEVDLEAFAKEKFNMVQGKLQVDDGKVNVNFNYKEVIEAVAVGSFGIDLTGNVDIGDKIIPLSFNKRRKSNEGKFSLKINSISASDFAAVFSKKPLVADNIPDQARMFTNTIINEPTIIGTLSFDGNYEVVLKGLVTGMSGLGEFLFFVVVQKPIDGPIAVAIIADIFNIPPAKILSTLTGKNLKKIPVVNDLMVNVLIEFANDDFVFLKDPKLNKMLSKYVTNAKTITKGAKIKLELPIKSVVKKLDKNAANAKQLPESIYVQIHIFQNHVSFKFPDNAPMDLENTVMVLIPDLPEIVFTKIIKTSPKITIPQFDIDIRSRAVVLKCIAPEEVILGNDLISLRNAEFELKHKSKKAWHFYMTASKKIAGKIMNVTLEKKEKNFVFTGQVGSFTAREIAENFGAQEASVETFGKFEFMDFIVKDVVISAVFGDDMQLHIKGKPVFFGYDNAEFEGFILDAVGVRKMAFGLIIKDIRMNELLQKVFKRKITQLNWMRDLTAIFTISNTDVQKSAYMTLPSKIRQGIFMSTEVTIPDDCRKEQMCEVMKDKMLPGTKLFLDGQVTLDGLQLLATYNGSGLKFGPSLVLRDVYALVNVGKSSEFSIRGQLVIANPQLSFRGKLSIGITGRTEIFLLMSGIWRHPFGMKFISFQNIQMVSAVQPSQSLHKLEFIGELHIGQSGLDKEIVTDVTIGFNPVATADNYVYGEIEDVSLMKLVDAFGWKIVLPKILADSKFVDGAMIGYTQNVKGKKILHLTNELQSGFTLSGMMLIMMKKFVGDIVLEKNSIIVDVDMSPLELSGGLLMLRRSSKDKENGPKLRAIITPDNVAVTIEAYAELLGMGSDIIMFITDAGLSFHMEGRMFNLIDVNLTIGAPYGKGDLDHLIFRVSSCFLSDIKEVTMETENFIMEAGSQTARALKECREKVADSMAWFQKANIKTLKWINKMNKKQKDLQRKSSIVDQIDSKLDQACVETCPKKCVGGPSMKEKCKRIFSKWMSCPVWDECKGRIRDAACIAKCMGAKVYLEDKNIKKKNAMVILIDSINSIKEVLGLVKEFVNKAKSFIILTQRASRKVEMAAVAGKEPMYAVARFNRQNLITIHHICFDTSLKKAHQACFLVSLEVTMGGRKRKALETSVCLDVNVVVNVARALCEELFVGMGSLKENIASAKEDFGDLQRMRGEIEMFFAELEKKETLVQGRVAEPVDQDDDDEDDLSNAITRRKDTTVAADLQTPVVHSEKYIRHQLYGVSPTVVIRDDLTLDAFESDSAWTFSQDDSPFTQILQDEEGNETAEERTKDDVPPLDTDVLEDQDDPNKCSQTKGLVSNYAVVSDAVTLLLSKLKAEKEKFSAEAKRTLVRTKIVEEEILSNCKRGNISEAREEDAMFYIYKLKNGTAKWIKNVEHQIEVQDKESLRMWRRSFADIIKINKGMDVQKFLDTLKMATEAAKKRHSIPDSVHDHVVPSLKSASKIVSDLLVGKDGSLSLKRSSIEKLHQNVAFLKKKIPCAA